MDDTTTYNEAKIAFKISEGREPNMNNSEDMRIVSAIQLGIFHAYKYYGIICKHENTCFVAGAFGGTKID